MENKLQELTHKLYAEGLTKGREQADSLIAEAEQKAQAIIAEAEQKAQKITSDAQKQAEEFSKNTLTEITLASRQSVATLKDAITNLIVSGSVSDSVSKATLDVAFVKDLLLAVAKNWNGVNGEKAQLEAQLPASKKAEFEKAFKASAKELISQGVEISYSDGVKSGFKIAPKDGGYYISFTDSDFDALLMEFLRPKVAKILFDK